MKFRLQMLQPNPIIARNSALQFKGALAQTHTKLPASAALRNYTSQKRQAFASLLKHLHHFWELRAELAPHESQQPQGRATELHWGSSRLPREERATCSSKPGNHFPTLRQENTPGKAVLAGACHGQGDSRDLGHQCPS